MRKCKNQKNLKISPFLCFCGPMLTFCKIKLIQGFILIFGNKLVAPISFVLQKEQNGRGIMITIIIDVKLGLLPYIHPIHTLLQA